MAFLCVLALPAAAAERFYEAAFTAKIQPGRSTIAVTFELSGKRLPSRIAFHIDSDRHRAFSSSDPVSQKGNVVTWMPSGAKARLTYEFVASHERAPKRYDSLVADSWAIFRADRMVPRMAVTGPRSLNSRTTLNFELPQGWSAATPYPETGGVFQVEDSARRHDRPAGWIIAGRLGVRSELIKGIQTIVAAPEKETPRRQDLLAFLNWNLPHLKDVFPAFPDRLLIATVGDPMWRGGLSGPSSLFLHADRPLISENRTSTVLHELVHVAMGIRGDEESDWIVEGLAEYYSLEILRRSGGIGRNRYDEAMDRMERWARESASLFTRESSGATTARAVVVMSAVDAEIRKLTNKKHSLDDVARALALDRGEVNLERLQTAARKVAGRELESLQRQRLNSPQAQRAAP